MKLSKSLIEEFENLAWLESKIENIRYKDNNLSFIMTDLISYTPSVIYEYVKVRIEGIKYLDLLLYPYLNGQYKKEECAVSFGNANIDNIMEFEGITKTNPFTDTKAEYFWLSASFEADSIQIERTGNKFKLSLA